MSPSDRVCGVREEGAGLGCMTGGCLCVALSGALWWCIFKLFAWVVS